MSTPRVLAVDSGAGHVACGVFTVGRSGRLSLEHFALEAFNPDAALEIGWPDQIKTSLGLITKNPAMTGSALLAVPGHFTLTKFVKTPAVEKSQRPRIIQFEAQQNIPYPLPEVVWDHLGVSDDGVDLEIMLSAVKLDVMENYCSSFTTAGIKPVGVIPSALSLYRSFKLNYPEVTGSVLVVSIGARSTNLLFIDGAKFFVRTINLAGNSVTQAIAEEIKQDFLHAEALKLQVLGGRSDLSENSPSRQSVATAASSFLARLHLEITRSTVNYRRQSGAEQPATIYVTGGGSLVPDLVETISEKTKLKVERFDPLKAVDLGKGAAQASEYQAILADLVGLAAKLTDKQQVPFNLLPPSIMRAQAFATQQPFYIGAAAAVAAGLLLPLWHYNTRIEVAREEISKLRTVISPLEKFKTANVENLQKIESAKKEVAAIQGLVETKSNWINFFTDLQERLVKVEDVWLESLQVVRSNTTASVQASKDSTEAPPPPVLRLKLSGRLLDVNNPVSKVSPDSFNRVKALLASFSGSQFISAVESEQFDPSQQGILRFDFTLVVNPAKPL